MLCGDHDTATPNNLIEASSRIGPHGRVQVLPNAGHKTYIDQNDAYLTAVEQFLQNGATRHDEEPSSS